MSEIVVVGLGPADEDLVTQGTREIIAAIPRRFLRTSRHPAASLLVSARSFDEFYDQFATFDEVYSAIVSTLLFEARAHGRIVYAVPGSPVVAERTVEMLRERAGAAGVKVTVTPALSFLDLSWVRLGIDPMSMRVTVVDAHRFLEDTRGLSGPFLVTQCHSQSVLSDVKLALSERVLDPSVLPKITVLARLGLSEESVVELPWHELDRAVAADHLTSLFIPKLPATSGEEMALLEELMRTLRASCPWDAEQTFTSLAPYVGDEALELQEAITKLEASTGISNVADIAHYRDELGDVVFQTLFHACLAEEEGWFDLGAVLRGLREKLVHRHPHVFPRDDFDASGLVTAKDVADNWQRIKNAPRSTT
jgi:tetrapyrrole methylase family protein / MazG family protein